MSYGTNRVRYEVGLSYLDYRSHHQPPHTKPRRWSLSIKGLANSRPSRPHRIPPQNLFRLLNHRHG